MKKHSGFECFRIKVGGGEQERGRERWSGMWGIWYDRCGRFKGLEVWLGFELGLQRGEGIVRLWTGVMDWVNQIAGCASALHVLIKSLLASHSHYPLHKQYLQRL